MTQQRQPLSLTWVCFKAKVTWEMRFTFAVLLIHNIGHVWNGDSRNLRYVLILLHFVVELLIVMFFFVVPEMLQLSTLSDSDRWFDELSWLKRVKCQISSKLKLLNLLLSFSQQSLKGHCRPNDNIVTKEILENIS